MPFNGVGVDRDETEAAKISRERAAAHANPIAQNRLAHLYVGGRGVPRATRCRPRYGIISPRPQASADPELDAGDRESHRRSK